MYCIFSRIPFHKNTSGGLLLCFLQAKFFMFRFPYHWHQKNHYYLNSQEQCQYEHEIAGNTYQQIMLYFRCISHTSGGLLPMKSTIKEDIPILFIFLLKSTTVYILFSFFNMKNRIKNISSHHLFYLFTV